MNDATDSARKTAAWKLWLGGSLGGVIVAVLAFLQGGDDPEHVKQMASSLGVWLVRLLLLGVIVAGGWRALRSSPNQGRVKRKFIAAAGIVVAVAVAVLVGGVIKDADVCPSNLVADTGGEDHATIRGGPHPLFGSAAVTRLSAECFPLHRPAAEKRPDLVGYKIAATATITYNSSRYMKTKWLVFEAISSSGVVLGSFRQLVDLSDSGNTWKQASGALQLSTEETRRVGSLRVRWE